MADNVIKFPMLRRLIDAAQAPGRWADEQAAPMKERMLQAQVNIEKNLDPNLDESEAMQRAVAMSDLAQSGGMLSGSMVDKARSLAAGPGMAGIKQAQDISKMLPATEASGLSATQQIIGAEHANRSILGKLLAAKRPAKWGN